MPPSMYGPMPAPPSPFNQLPLLPPGLAPYVCHSPPVSASASSALLRGMPISNMAIRKFWLMRFFLQMSHRRHGSHENLQSTTGKGTENKHEQHKHTQGSCHSCWLQSPCRPMSPITKHRSHQSKLNGRRRGAALCRFGPSKVALEAHTVHNPQHAIPRNHHHPPQTHSTLLFLYN